MRNRAMAILESALAAADPRAAVRCHLDLRDHHLRIVNKDFDLDNYRRVFVIGAGKASGAMAAAVEGLLGDLLCAGVVIVKEGYGVPTSRVKIIEAGHPVPDQAGLDATREVIALADQAGASDLVIALISGGCSALLIAPALGLTLDHLRAVNTSLLRSGATINEINTVRKHLSRVKGGKLAQLVAPAALVTLVISDVIGSPVGVIGSGPTVADDSTPADALAVIHRYALEAHFPAAVLNHLHEATQVDADAPPPHGDVFVIASIEQAAAAAVGKAAELGMNALLLSTSVEGEAREVGRVLASIAKEIRRSGRPIRPPACVVMGGETTVTVRGDGQGGRNQELALSAAMSLDGIPDVAVVAFATDGTDGPTDAAGAWVDGSTLARGRQLGLDASRFLANNDAFRYLGLLNDLITTGPTQTNVNDLALILVW